VGDRTGRGTGGRSPVERSRAERRTTPAGSLSGSLGTTESAASAITTAHSISAPAPNRDAEPADLPSHHLRGVPRPILVTWRDAHFDFEERDVRTDYLVHTVGFVVKEGPLFLSVAQEVLPDGDGYRAVTHIPHAVVINKEAL
jgi:hypothetical protein